MVSIVKIFANDGSVFFIRYFPCRGTPQGIAGNRAQTAPALGVLVSYPGRKSDIDPGTCGFFVQNQNTAFAGMNRKKSVISHLSDFIRINTRSVNDQAAVDDSLVCDHGCHLALIHMYGADCAVQKKSDTVGGSIFRQGDTYFVTVNIGGSRCP